MKLLAESRWKTIAPVASSVLSTNITFGSEKPEVLEKLEQLERQKPDLSEKDFAQYYSLLQKKIKKLVASLFLSKKEDSQGEIPSGFKTLNTMLRELTFEKIYNLKTNRDSEKQRAKQELLNHFSSFHAISSWGDLRPAWLESKQPVNSFWEDPYADPWLQTSSHPKQSEKPNTNILDFNPIKEQSDQCNKTIEMAIWRRWRHYNALHDVPLEPRVVPVFLKIIQHAGLNLKEKEQIETFLRVQAHDENFTLVQKILKNALTQEIVTPQEMTQLWDLILPSMQITDREVRWKLEYALQHQELPAFSHDEIIAFLAFSMPYSALMATLKEWYPSGSEQNKLPLVKNIGKTPFEQLKHELRPFESNQAFLKKLVSFCFKEIPPLASAWEQLLVEDETTTDKKEKKKLSLTPQEVSALKAFLELRNYWKGPMLNKMADVEHYRKQMALPKVDAGFCTLLAGEREILEQGLQYSTEAKKALEAINTLISPVEEASKKIKKKPEEMQKPQKLKRVG